jgi:hypothetical protein
MEGEPKDDIEFRIEKECDNFYLFFRKKFF